MTKAAVAVVHQARRFAGNTMTVFVFGEETGGTFAALRVIKPTGTAAQP
jgi:hypothetical protein